MSKQKIVTGNNRTDFENGVQELLDKRWTIVPNTLTTCIASSPGTQVTFHKPYVYERWVVVLEKKEKSELSVGY